jgi:pilus assembly protein CpaC
MIAVNMSQFWRSRQQSRRPAAFFAALVVYIIVVLVAAPQAQQPTFTPATANSMPPVRDAVSGSEIELLVGRSTVLNVGSPIARVSLTVPDIADAMVTAPMQLLVHGKQPGTISLFVWDKAGAIKTFEVKVRRDLSALAAHYKQLFAAEDITILGSGKDVVISGTVSSKYVIEKAGEIAAGYVEKKENVVNMLKQQEGVASNQVMLRVRFAEVSRSALTELGANFFTGPTGYKDWIARTTTQQFAAPNYTDLTRTADLDDNLTGASGKYSLSDFLNIFVFNNKYNIGTVIRALQERGLFQSLAEPNLIATNGKEASFLAGGEFPYPVVQGSTTGNSITIQFKEFGVRLTFTPTVLGGDLVNLKVKPEVSALDFANGVTVEGFRVPALSTRRTETEVELRDGQTFAIAGLLNNSVTDSMRKIPGIGDIPILGWLFKSKALAKNQTELVVMITPQIIKKGQMGVSNDLPTPVEPYLGAPHKTTPNPAPYTGSPRYPVGTKPGGDDNNNAAAAAKPATPPAAPAKTTPTQTAPVPSRPIAQPAPVAAAPQPPASKPATPQTGASQAPAATKPAPKPAQAQAPAASAPKPATPSRAEQRAMEQERKAAEAEAKQKAEQQRAAQIKAEDDRRQADRLAKERAKREAEIARKNAEAAKKQADEDQKREKALADAAARLKAAQAAYQAEIEKSKGGSNDKPKEPGKGGSAPQL